jgi:hypothetical protein
MTGFWGAVRIEVADVFRRFAADYLAVQGVR